MSATLSLKKIISFIINEEIGRDRKTQQKIDKFPWETKKFKASIRYNYNDDTFTGTLDDSKRVITKTSKDVEDIKHWLRSQQLSGGGV